MHCLERNVHADVQESLARVNTFLLVFLVSAESSWLQNPQKCFIVAFVTSLGFLGVGFKFAFGIYVAACSNICQQSYASNGITGVDCSQISSQVKLTNEMLLLKSERNFIFTPLGFKQPTLTN